MCELEYDPIRWSVVAGTLSASATNRGAAEADAAVVDADTALNPLISAMVASPTTARLPACGGRDARRMLSPCWRTAVADRGLGGHALRKAPSRPPTVGLLPCSRLLRQSPRKERRRGHPSADST